MNDSVGSIDVGGSNLRAVHAHLPAAHRDVEVLSVDRRRHGTIHSGDVRSDDLSRYNVIRHDHLRHAFAILGLPEFLSCVAVPLLCRIGDEWHAGRFSPAQEHFASGVLYDIIVERMRAFTPRDDAPRILIATPAGERHAIGAALVGAGAAVEGWRVIYLGVDLPAQEIVAAAIAGKVSVVALSVLYVEDRKQILGELRSVRSHLPSGIPLFVGGSGALTLARELSAPGIRVSDNVAELYDELRRSREI